MEHTITFPDVGEGVQEGEVVAWLKNVGDPVAKDEPVVEVMTDKATVELPSPYAGVLVKQHVAEGEVALLDKPLYDIETEKPLATPATRHLAKELGVDLATVTPTGDKGRITKQDLTGIPKMMARKMTESHLEIPAFSFFEQVEATRLIQLHDKVKKEAEEEGFKATFMPYLIRALSLTLREFPQANSSYRDEKVLTHEEHNIGIAFSTEKGLIVPVLKEVEKMDLRGVIQAFDSLRKKELTLSDMKGGTITISNFGPLSPHGLFATPIINHPECAILAVGRIHKAPVVVNDEVVVREVLNLSWTFDHRIIDGDLAAKISNRFAEFLNNPASLL